MAQVNLELGRPETQAINLNELAVRNLAGVTSGPISMNDLRGKSNTSVWVPDGGTIGSPVILSDVEGNDTTPSQVTISYATGAIWNWTKTGSASGTASTPTGQSNPFITFSLPNPTTTPRSCVFSVNSVASGVTKYWTVNLTNNGAA